MVGRLTAIYAVRPGLPAPPPQHLVRLGFRTPWRAAEPELVRAPPAAADFEFAGVASKAIDAAARPSAGGLERRTSRASPAKRHSLSPRLRTQHVLRFAVEVGESTFQRQYLGVSVAGERQDVGGCDRR